jgi:hypothetical protein
VCFTKRILKPGRSIADPGSGALLTPGSVIRVRDGEKNPDRGYGMNKPDHISETLENFLG